MAIRRRPRPLGLLILLGLTTSVLLDFCFPVAGPLPPWRASLAWVALVPLLYALLAEPPASHRRYLQRAFLTSYLSGILWYILNCYWIYQTMYLYGHVPPVGSDGIVVLFSAVLGLYFGLFGVLTAFFRRRFGLISALALTPFLWAALELAAARITSVPWDQLGYSQVDNLWLTRLAPWTGVYGVSFVLVAVAAACTAALLHRRYRLLGLAAVSVAAILQAGSFLPERPSSASAHAILLQPNIQVAADAGWTGNEWHGGVGWLIQQVQSPCTPAYTGMPKAHTPPPDSSCIPPGDAPGVVIWPETASWFQSNDPRTLAAVASVATAAHAPFIAGMLGQDSTGTYNSALFVRADGAVAGRYDKIHLVPFGEYIPYRNLFFFAHKLTHQVDDLQRGAKRVVFTTDGHSFGTFICYESVFADEVRHFALNGAQALVNISDDGWYGDTSAPWQHLDMTRMRAVENHRWILLDTNSGVTTAIDPRGRVTYSAPRHALTSLDVPYGYRSDVTFYTRHGDIFAYLCCALILAALAGSLAARKVSQP